MRVNKSAKTGKIVSEKFAKNNPDTTFTQEIDMKKHDTKHDTKVETKDADTKTEEANEEAVELDKKAEAANEPAKDGSLDKTPTDPQIQTTAPANIVSSPEGVDTKTVKFEAQSGDPGGPKTTIVEEARILEGGDNGDRAETIRAMAVLAQSQGINQVKALGQAKNDAGVKCDEVLTVYQNGTHSVDLVPTFEKDRD